MKEICFLLLFFWGSINLVLAQEVYQAHTHVKLVSEQDGFVPGKIFWVGVNFILDEGWHIYWRNPGDSGLAPKIKWELSSGVKVGEFQWPYPKRLNVGPLTSFGYDREILLLIPVKVDKNSQSFKALNLHARLDWLACRDICVPGKAKLDLSEPVLSSLGVAFNGYKTLFDQTRQNIPHALSSIKVRAYLDGNRWHLLIQTSQKGKGDIVFYPFRDDVIEHPSPQQISQTNNGYELIVTKSHIFQESLKSLEGVVVNSAGWDEQGKIKAIRIDVHIDQAPPVQIPFLLACFFALIGGLILNLMPCVLPVLSIKVLHLVERHPDQNIALRHSLIYALGILVSVWTLALLLFILKAAGQFAGWGFQFQSPVFVIVVALILLVLALNLFGVFEFTMPSINGLPTQRAGYQASFISGVITTIVASPCTAPLMGTALTVAISQPGIIGFGIFTFLGLGLSLPFVLLSVFPALLSFVPKPGMWMIHLKKFLGFILLLCVVWLVWIFGIQTGIGDLSKFFKSSQEMNWQVYSSTAVDQARSSGHGVFIDFTADWCINCQVNDRLILQNSDVIKAFKDRGIIVFKADWTKYDPVITQALSALGRDSIPVYVYYPPGSNSPSIFPQLITPQIILERIKRN